MEQQNQPLNPNTQTQTLQTTPDNKGSVQIAGGYYDGQTWGVMKMMAQTFIEAKAFPSDIVNVPQAMVRLQAGREIGLMPIESMKYISLINGRPSLWGEKAIEMVISAGHRVEWNECSDKMASCTITRGDTGKSMSQTFTIEMANARGLTKKGGPWLTAPENMLKFKAFHAIAKFLVPDALRGAGITEIEETEMPVVESLSRSTGVAGATVAAAEQRINRLKPLAERIAEKDKPQVVEGAVVNAQPANPDSIISMPKNIEEPVYEPIAPTEPAIPVIQVASPLPPPKPNEGVAARKIREAIEKNKLTKSPDQF